MPMIAAEKPASPGCARARRASSARAKARRSGRPAASPTLGVSSSATRRISPWARAGRPLASALQRPRSSTDADAAAGRREAIDGAIGRAVAAVAAARFVDRQIARRRRIGGHEFGETRAGRQRARRERGERLGGVGAPGQAVAGDVPIVDDRAQAIEGRARIKRERVGDARFARFVSPPAPTRRSRPSRPFRSADPSPARSPPRRRNLSAIG